VADGRKPFKLQTVLLRSKPRRGTRTRSAQRRNEPALAGEHQKRYSGSHPSDACREPACNISAVWTADVIKTKKGGRYAEPRVPVQEGRERQACLARTVETPQGPAVNALGVSISEI